MTPSFLRPFCRSALPATSRPAISRPDTARSGAVRSGMVRPGSLAALGILLTGTALLTAGCQHRDTIDTTVDAAHAAMGGEISRLHPPTPGYGGAPPNIALIPTTTPDFPSAEARSIITNRLEADRNISQRIAASGGALPIGMVNPPPVPGRDGGSMTLTSQAGNAGAGSPAASRGGETSPTAPAGSTTPGSSLTYQPISHALPVHLPDPGQAPEPLLFPGFTLPDAVTSLIPDFEAADPAGTLIRFQPETDRIANDQDDAFSTIIRQRRHHRLIIRGFGTTLTARTGLGPAEQAQEIALALLRAKAVARHLASLGVPVTDMRLTGEALGDGVRVTYEKNIHPDGPGSDTAPGTTASHSP